MDFKLIEKLKDLSWALAIIYLIYAYMNKVGHTTGAVIVATVLLLLVLTMLIIEDKILPNINLPECSLGADILVIVAAIVCVCLAETGTDFSILPMMVFGFVGAILDIVRLIGTGTFKNKSFKDIFNEQLRLPIFLDVVILFWPIHDGFKNGWDSLEAADFVFIGFFTLDLIHNLIILPSVHRKEKQIVREYLEQLKDEKESLASVDIDTNGFDEETRKLVIDRIDLIDHILIGKMSDNAVFSRKVNKKIEKVIADRSSFIESLALHYAVSHPQAVERLQQSGLSRYEIGLCCLYYMGYNGKEVKDISDTSMVYHVNSTIRQKLGLKTNDVNLSTFIRELFGTN
jgi:hypothetical protein